MSEIVLVAERAKVSKEDLGSFINFVTEEHPLISNNQEKIAEAIELEFGVICDEQDVINYQDLHVEVEDYELEDRRHVYGVIY